MNYRHGHERKDSETATYRTWASMLARSHFGSACRERYLDKGIRVCKRWLVFSNFLADMGERPPGMTIDRIKNWRGYSPKNCRWASRREQCINRSMTIFMSLNGKRQCLTDWANELGIKQTTLSRRLHDGWSHKEALTIKPDSRHGRKGRTHCDVCRSKLKTRTLPGGSMTARYCFVCQNKRRRELYALNIPDVGDHP